MKIKVKDLEYYQNKAMELVKANANLRVMQQGIERLVHLDYELPDALRHMEWVRKFVSSSPHEAIQAGVRTLAAVMPRIRVESVSVSRGEDDPESQEMRAKANSWEKSLMWQLELSSSRQGNLIGEVVRSALKDDEICGQVIYLPEQIKNVEAMGGNANRYKAALNHGDFAIVLKDPKTVYARYSQFMCEAVGCIEVVTPQELVDAWGNKATEISEMIERDDDKLPDSYILVDYNDYEARAVWAIPGDDVQMVLSGEDIGEVEGTIVIMPPTEREFPFLDWVCERGGTSLESDPMYQRVPLLFAPWKTDQWFNANVAGTLMQSEAIAHAAAPKFEINGPNSDLVDIEYADPAQVIRTSPGQKINPLPQTGLDPAQRELLDRSVAIMEKSTIASILVTADSQPNESFSSYNLRVNSAVGSLMPWRGLSERWIVQCLKTMLYWIHYTKRDLKGYGKGRKDSGKLYTISGKDIDPTSLYLSVKLVTDQPTDRLQKINGAVMMKRELPFPSYLLLEELGVTDAEGAFKDYWFEQLTGAAMQGKLQLVTAQAANQIEQMAAQMAQQMLQEAMAGAEQEAGGQPPMGGQPPQDPAMAGAMGGMPPDMMGGMGMEGVEGQGFDAGMGGAPGVQANPEMAMGGTMGMQ